MGKTKRHSKTKCYRKTKGRKTKGRKTKKTLKRGGGNVPFSDIIKDIQKLPKDEFKAKYIEVNEPIPTIFKRKYFVDNYISNYKCTRRLPNDVTILSKLGEAIDGKTDDYKHNLYEVVKIMFRLVNKCISDIYPRDNRGGLYKPVANSNKILFENMIKLETELGIKDVDEVPVVNEVPLVAAVPIEKKEILVDEENTFEVPLEEEEEEEE